MIKEEIELRGVPDVLKSVGGENITDVKGWEANREKLKELLSVNEYGLLPPPPKDKRFEIQENDERYFANTGIYQKILITVTMENGEFSFPIQFIRPKTEGRHKTVVFLNFRNDVPDKYYPAEEICDNCIAVAMLYYKDVTSDDGDFTNGLAGLLYKNGERGQYDAGKIMMWAWAAMRVMDFLETQDSVDLKNVAVLGHSRLGKTALVTAAYDERFAIAHSNDSGCSGAAITRQKTGEHVDDICRNFPFWFCENYKTYRNNEDAMPFDQHYLLALIAPRYVSVGSASEDLWADPVSEFLSCAAASDVFALYGKEGFVAPDRLPQVDDAFFEGSIGYYLRGGSHYLGRYDWNRFIEFWNKHEN